VQTRDVTLTESWHKGRRADGHIGTQLDAAAGFGFAADYHMFVEPNSPASTWVEPYPDNA